MKQESPYKKIQIRTPAGQVFSYDSTTTASSSEDEGEVDPDEENSHPSPHVCRRRSTVIRVDSALKRGWDILTVIVSIIFYWHSSLPPQERSEVITAIEPLWFFTDIVLNFRTEIILSDGRSLCCPDEIAKHYVKTWFLLDLLCALPFDHLISSLSPKPRPKGKLRKAFSKVGQAIKGGWGNVKRNVVARIPARLREGKLRKLRQAVNFLALFDVPRLKGARHVIKYRSMYRLIGYIIRFVRQLLRLHVMSLGARVMSKLWAHLTRRWPVRRRRVLRKSSSKETPRLSLSRSGGKTPKTKLD